MADSGEEMAERSPAPAWMAWSLAGLLAFGILTLWVAGLWALSAVQAGICLLGIAYLLGVLVRGFPLRAHPLLLPLAGAVLWGCLQLGAGRTLYGWATANAVQDWFIRLAAFFLGLQVYSTAVRRRRVLRAWVWFGFLLGVAAVLQKFTSPGRVFWLFETPAAGGMGPFVYHNQFAAFIETLLPLALVAALTEREGRWWYPVMGGALFASVVAAASRAGVAMLAAESVAVFLLARRRRPVSRRGVLAVAASSLVLVAIFIAAVGWEPLWRKFQREDQYGHRRDLLYSSLEMARDRPLTGFGLGTWSLAYPAYARFDDGRFDNQAHNDWVQWAAEGGLPFFALMALLAGLLVRPAVRSVWGVGLLAVLVHCLVDYHFQQRPAFGYYYFALAGLMVREAGEGRQRLPQRL